VATDYDSPRRGVDVLDTVDEVSTLGRIAGDRRRSSDVDGPDAVDTLELPGADLSGEELVVVVEPMRTDEFRCGSCFLVQSRQLVAGDRRGAPICRDCAA
jgi:hypothetical protein